MPKKPFCKICDSTQHYSAFCWKRNGATGTKYQQLKVNGKHYRKWLKTKQKWYKKNSSDHYACYICGKWMTREETTLDHIIPRSRAPELRYELSNIAPACWACNSEKGSKVIENS